MFEGVGWFGAIMVALAAALVGFGFVWFLRALFKPRERLPFRRPRTPPSDDIPKPDPRPEP
jgi:hypothetical protein